MNHRRLESSQLRGELVGSDSQLGQPIAPFIVTNGGAGDPGVRVSGRDVNPGKDPARLVRDRSTDDAGGLLGIGAGKGQEKKDC